MKSLVENEVPLKRRIELIISYTEESDWKIFKKFLGTYPPPDINIVVDSNFPVVVGEKGWGAIFLTFPLSEKDSSQNFPSLNSFTGGSYISQVPATSEALIRFPTAEIEQKLRITSQKKSGVRFTFDKKKNLLTIRARGRAAHTAAPWEGKNAISNLAALLSEHEWPETQSAKMMKLINDLVGTGDYAERFGNLAYSHPIMGKLTLSLTKLYQKESNLVAEINFRRPIGRSQKDVEFRIAKAIDEWKERTGIFDLEHQTEMYEPYYQKDAPHVPTLLKIFKHYSGMKNVKPITIGGGTHARLLPNGVNFGPSMPGSIYTGHSAHEFVEQEEFLIGLKIHMAALIELAGK
jgi:dipeptidase D